MQKLYKLKELQVGNFDFGGVDAGSFEVGGVDASSFEVGGVAITTIKDLTLGFSSIKVNRNIRPHDSRLEVRNYITYENRMYVKKKKRFYFYVLYNLPFHDV